MAKATTKKASAKRQTATDQVAMLAYLNWERETGGNPVDEERTRQFWLDAEQELRQQTEESQE